MPRSPRSSRRPPARRSGADRTRYASGTPWEPKVGYSRAVRVGQRIYVSGTTATSPDGSLVGLGDAYAQTVQALDNIERALTALGSGRADIVRVRVLVTDIHDFEAIARALGERFGDVRPANTLVQVAALIDPAMKVEIEADAEVPKGR
ncbi:MAG TPA: RidA family protein [Thermoplasmata archaeon]|nr:RidA family protein [Thermoplasmata archaeon]